MIIGHLFTKYENTCIRNNPQKNERAFFQLERLNFWR